VSATRATSGLILRRTGSSRLSFRRPPECPRPGRSRLPFGCLARALHGQPDSRIESVIGPRLALESRRKELDAMDYGAVEKEADRTLLARGLAGPRCAGCRRNCWVIQAGTRGKREDLHAPRESRPSATRRPAWLDAMGEPPGAAARTAGVSAKNGAQRPCRRQFGSTGENSGERSDPQKTPPQRAAKGDHQVERTSESAPAALRRAQLAVAKT